jgi:hypothetical protein
MISIYLIWLEKLLKEGWDHGEGDLSIFLCFSESCAGLEILREGIKD